MNLKEIAENHGLTPEGVDYALTQYRIVICEITHGMLSKLSYDAKDIIRTAQERWCDTCDLNKQEPVEPDGENFGECGYTLHRINYDGPDKELRHEWFRFCPACGKAVKWYG